MSSRRVAVFLDRDGTLNEEVSCLRNPDDLRPIPGAGAAVGIDHTAHAVSHAVDYILNFLDEHHTNIHN